MSLQERIKRNDLADDIINVVAALDGTAYKMLSISRKRDTCPSITAEEIDTIKDPRRKQLMLHFIDRIADPRDMKLDKFFWTIFYDYVEMEKSAQDRNKLNIM